MAATEEALLDDQRRKRGERLRGRDGIVHGVGGLLFVLVAAVLPFVVDTGGDPHAVTVRPLVGRPRRGLRLRASNRVRDRYRLRDPDEIVLVPMLFLLPVGCGAGSRRVARVG